MIVINYDVAAQTVANWLSDGKITDDRALELLLMIDQAEVSSEGYGKGLSESDAIFDESGDWCVRWCHDSKGNPWAYALMSELKVADLPTPDDIKRLPFNHPLRMQSKLSVVSTESGEVEVDIDALPYNHPLRRKVREDQQKLSDEKFQEQLSKSAPENESKDDESEGAES